VRLTAAFLAVAITGGAAGAAATIWLGDGTSGEALAVDRPAAALDGKTLDIAAVIAKAEPSVVSISVSFDGGRLGGSFGGSASAGAGTGVIISADGEVLTNAHVVDGASTVRVTLSGESQSRTARVVGVDEAADLALLRIEDASDLPAAELGRSADLQVGDDVVAIGNALALRGNPTVTRGIVSGLDRTLDAGASTMTGLIQTDASISSGNSGGPLLNAAGEVVGINTAVAASNGRTSAENVGFAIAIDRALPVIERLRSGGEAPSHGVLGVRTTDPADGSRGALIASVEPGSAAESAGLQPGDLVTKLDGSAIDGAASLGARVREHAPGDRVELALVRDGQERTITVRLGGGGS